MRNRIRIGSTLTSFLLLIIITGGCFEDRCNTTRKFQEWIPVSINGQDLRGDLVVTGPREIENPGKIYYYKDLILVNEREEGIHIIDNSNPASPQFISFIEILSNLDMAVKDDRLYADNLMDLIVIDISNPVSPLLLERVENVFPGFEQSTEGEYIIEYEPTNHVVELTCDDPNYDEEWFHGYHPDFQSNGVFVNQAFFSTADFTGPSIPMGNPSTGMAGSMAAFSLVDNFLYTIHGYGIKVFDVSGAEQTEHVNTTGYIGRIETIFPYEQYLFLGANDGMYILDNTDPANPQKLSSFDHATACDPVFVQGELAYVTLRDGRICDGFNNQLDVVNIANLQHPYLVASHEMTHPHGLSVQGDLLFLCEGAYGLKTFDVSDPNKISENMLSHMSDLHAFDVISVTPEHLLMVGQDGIYQYDASDPANLVSISKIPVYR